MQKVALILASASPRRADLLTRLGLSLEIIRPAVDETPQPGESPAAMAARLAASKCSQVAGRCGTEPDRIILAADTVVVLGDRILGKPVDREDAVRMLLLLGGRSHQVLTAVSLYRTGTGRQVHDLRSTEVRFHALDRSRIDWYVATGEPDDKAGAYGIQGAGAVLVEGILGSWSNVVGLPVEMLPFWLEELGVDFQELAGQPTSPA